MTPSDGGGAMDIAEDFYQRLIAPIEDQMIAIVSKIVGPGGDAPDVFQEVLVIVWRKLGRISRHPNPHAYIFRICVSQSYEAVRRRIRQKKHLSQFWVQARQPIQVKPPEQGAPAAAGADLVHKTILKLPPQQAKAVLLRFVDRMSYERIGGILGCSEVTARSHVARGRARLRELLPDRRDSDVG